QRTIVDICTADAPFLVDSVTAAIARRGLSVHLVVHPVVSVSRDADGDLVELDSSDGQLESWMHLEVDRVPTEDERAALEGHLREVIDDVHAAVDDWQPMRQKCLDIVAELRAAPPATVDPASVQPTIDFLTWPADDHFTFLGYREQVLETDADGEETLRSRPESGLGILRGSETSVARLTPEAQRTARSPRLLTITKANSRATVHRDVYLDYIGVRTFDAAGEVTGERRFLGLFTSAAYAASVPTRPIATSRVPAVLDAACRTPQRHTGEDVLRSHESS